MKPLTANELRIGNYVGYGALHTGIGGYDHYTVKEITENCAFFRESKVGEYHKDIAPIPLTEEWLVKFGFEVRPWGWVYLNSNYLGFRLTLNKYRYEISGEKGPVMESVHQLQNLYFALTGEELTIKS